MKAVVKFAMMVAVLLMVVPAQAELPAGVPAPTDVPGKEYSHHQDINAAMFNDPMQNLAWDGTGNAWDTFDYGDMYDWPTGTNVDAIANIRDRLFHEVVNDEVALLVTIDEGLALGAATRPMDYENIHYQTAGAASQAGIWARGVVYGAAPPPTSEIQTNWVQARALADPGHLFPWINPTGIEVWGPEVKEGEQGQPGTGDDANMFSTNADWAWNQQTGLWVPQPAVFKFDPPTGMCLPYIWADQIQAAIGAEADALVDVDAMMIFDQEEDDYFGPGDSIMFSIHTWPGSSPHLYDGGEIWVWNYGDASATFLTHGGVTWNTANVVAGGGGAGGVFPNVFMEENIGGLEAVPEPATLVLLLIGAAVLLLRRRK